MIYIKTLLSGPINSTEKGELPLISYSELPQEGAFDVVIGRIIEMSGLQVRTHMNTEVVQVGWLDKKLRILKRGVWGVAQAHHTAEVVEYADNLYKLIA